MEKAFGTLQTHRVITILMLKKSVLLLIPTISLLVGIDKAVITKGLLKKKRSFGSLLMSLWTLGLMLL